MKGKATRRLSVTFLIVSWVCYPLAAQSPVAAVPEQDRSGEKSIERPLSLRVLSFRGPEAVEVLREASARDLRLDTLGASVSWQDPQQGSRGRRRSVRIALAVLGAAVAGAGGYLVSTAKPMWFFTPSIGPRAGDTRCVDYNPYAGTGYPENRCPSTKVAGYILIGTGALISAIGVFGR